MSEVDQTPTEGGQTREVIRLVYVGPGSNSKANVWRMPDGSPGVFGRLMKGRVPGGIYSVETRNGGQTVYPSTLRYTGELADDAAQLQLDAMNKERRLAAERLNKNTPRTVAIDATLGDLLALARNLSGYQAKRVLVDYVAAKIYDA